MPETDINKIKRNLECECQLRPSEVKILIGYIAQLENQLKATEKACIEWKNKYEEANKK